MPRASVLLRWLRELLVLRLGLALWVAIDELLVSLGVELIEVELVKNYI